MHCARTEANAGETGYRIKSSPIHSKAEARAMEAQIKTLFSLLRGYVLPRAHARVISASSSSRTDRQPGKLNPAFYKSLFARPTEKDNVIKIDHARVSYCLCVTPCIRHLRRHNHACAHYALRITKKNTSHILAVRQEDEKENKPEVTYTHISYFVSR